MLRIKEGLKDIKPAELLVKTERILAHMTGNIHFPSPNPSLAEVSVAFLAFRQATEQAFGRDHAMVSIRKEKTKELKHILSNLASYVQYQSKGNPEIALSSGFELRRRKSPTGALPAPTRVRTCYTQVFGTILLRWKPVRNASMYIVEINAANPNDESGWTFAGYSKKAKMLLEHLETGNIYWLRVKAMGTAGIGAVSDAARGLAW